MGAISLMAASNNVVEARKEMLDIICKAATDSDNLKDMNPNEFAMLQAFIKLVEATNELTEQTNQLLAKVDMKLNGLG